MFMRITLVVLIVSITPLYAIRPGQTKKYRVWEGNTDRHYTSKNGLRAFTIWVGDDQTVVEAQWHEEVRGGYKWVLRGKARISGKHRRFSRTVYLRSRENFRLTVKGIRSSRGKRKICYYWIRCVDNPSPGVSMYNSKNLQDLRTWFKAGPYQYWYWGGCATWVMANPLDKQIFLFDGYVSKATIGGVRNFDYVKVERKRVARLVNLLRHFIGRGYKVESILTSHKHGDHLGDIPYILGGIKATTDSDFMRTGIALTGKAQKAKVSIVMSYDASFDPYYGKSGYDSNYLKPTRNDISMPTFHDRYTNAYNPRFSQINGQRFSVGTAYRFGKVMIRSYIWDHGNIADGGPGSRGGLRTLAYRITRVDGQKAASVFFTSGFCEDISFVSTLLLKFISCHHIILAWNGHEQTAQAAKVVNLLDHSPVKYNYIFANHTDNNSNPGGMTDERDEVIDMFGMLIEKGIIASDHGTITSRIKWLGQNRQVRLGAFSNRVGVD
ncbi:hypothetical protein [Candidatus Uabimicrobium amorphum]|uniref:Metallo-beta-lactamase domain-containing protein n=1 Tax=Uabimicrobium amorphum TaxID=2596890 RepID=A0A5S9IN37_UABAM|nr:hypothetical protein [Candidatus Uabimicrobium amorphum]BBM84567.1 hypothetical protein UABAM_02928 [Candidatus Uabimicrobium amorphum]